MKAPINIMFLSILRFEVLYKSRIFFPWKKHRFTKFHARCSLQIKLIACQNVGGWMHTLVLYIDILCRIHTRPHIWILLYISGKFLFVPVLKALDSVDPEVNKANKSLELVDHPKGRV